MLNDKKVIGLGIIILIIIGGFSYLNFKKNKERKELVGFVQEHNISIEKENKVGKQETSPQGKVEVVEINDGSISLNTGSIDGVDFNSLIQDEVYYKERKIIPYTEPLPEMPDEEENNSTLYGVDVNVNGVRDDLEIITVKEFGYNKDLTEVILAGLRAKNYHMYLAENFAKNGRIPFDLGHEDEILDNIDYMVGCMAIFDDNYSFNNYHDKIYLEVFNSSERKQLNKIIGKSIIGGTTPAEINRKTCQEFIQKTKDEYSNF